MLKVTNHKDFCCFDYESEINPNQYQLGDVLFKNYTGQEPEIGVVIQTFEDGDFRTDMWGMSYESEVRPATLLDIKRYRPKLMNSLLIQ
jgi:hypothetical protein